jgi:outer membrane receptor for ferrienterochelin and colicin
MNPKFNLLVLALLACLPSFSQSTPGKATIKARISDMNQEALPFASVSLQKLPDSTIVRITSTNEEGIAYFDNLPEGEYALTSSFVGYESQMVPGILLVGDRSVVLNDIRLKSNSTQLSEVVVRGDIGITELSPGKIVYRASELTSQTGGTAGDILKSMPSVAMGGSPNHNRDIRLRGLGNGYTQVLINGKTSGISGNNRETVLDQIPASAIDYIEIITNPSAEYQADGINGIVNIVLKKGFGDHALKGTVSFIADNADGYNGSVSLSQQKEKFEYFVTYDLLQRTINNDKLTEKVNFKNGTYDGTQITDQRESKSFRNENLRINANYKPWKNALVSGGLIYGRQLEVKTKTITINTTKADDSFKDASNRTEPESKDNKYYEYSLDFKQSFKNGSVLKTSFSYLDLNQPKIKEINAQKLNANGTYNGNPSMQLEDEMMNDDNYFATVDYTLPIGKRNKLKAGYRLASLNRDLVNSLSVFNHTEGKWETTKATEKNFYFSEKTNAWYVSDEFRWNFIKINAGLRAEHTDLNTQSPLDQIDKNSQYLMLLPTGNVQISLDTTQYFVVSAGKRLRRPAFNDINPFVDNRDPLKVKQGNPDLRPEYSYNYEIGYFKNFRKFNVGVNFFYRDIHDLIQKVITEDENNIQYEMPDNFIGAYLQGVEIMASIRATRWWTINASYSYFESKINDPEFNGDALKDQVQFSAKLISDFKLPKDINIQIAGNYLGPKPSVQESENELYFVDIGLSKGFLTNGIFMLRVSDVFDTIVKRKSKTTDVSITNETENTRGKIISAGLKWNF